MNLNKVLIISWPAKVAIVVLIIFLGLVVAASSFAQESKPISGPVPQLQLPRLDPKLQDIITKAPTSTVSIIIVLSYDVSLQTKDKIDASELGDRIRELQKAIQEMASSGVRGDFPEYVALLEEFNEAETARNKELTSRLDAANKPGQDGISDLIESLGGEVIYKYTVPNSLAARIEAQQIPKLLESPLVGRISGDEAMAALAGGMVENDKNRVIILLAIIAVGLVVFFLSRRRVKQ